MPDAARNHAPAAGAGNLTLIDARLSSRSSRYTPCRGLGICGLGAGLSRAKERGAVEQHLQALSAALPLLAGAVLFVTAALPNHGTISVGDFLVVYTAFMVFQAAVTRLGASFGAVAAIVPALDQIRPLLAALPETTAAGEAVETLGGDIVFDHVSFRYDAHGPLILDDVSIHARPGEFVAIAGESGAGKSTLFRLALGLDEPTSGAVYYDGRDLGHLNIKQVRRRIGAVPQAVQLHPEDV